MELHRRIALARAHRQPERPRLGVPVGALEDAGLALEPESVSLGDVLGARREDVEDEGATGLEELAGPLAEPAASLPRPACGAASGTGRSTSCDALGTGGSRRSPTRRSRSSPTPCSSASARATPSIPSDRSMPITLFPRCAIGTAMRPIPTASSTTGPLDAPRLVDVEGDVLDDRRAPRVVDRSRWSRRAPRASVGRPLVDEAGRW